MVSLTAQASVNPAGYRQSLLLMMAVVSFLIAMAGMGPAYAQSVSLNNANPITDGSSNWVTGSLSVSSSSIPGGATLTILNGGTVSSGSGAIGNTNIGTVTVSGYNGNASAWTINGGLNVGTQGGNGMLIINGGGVVNSNVQQGFIGRSNGTGTVIVSGTDGHGHVSTWNLTDNPNYRNLDIGVGGNGTLRIENGGWVGSGQGTVGTGAVIVSGSGGVSQASTWENSSLRLGLGGIATLNIANGGAVITDGIGHVGYDTGGSGTATVSGHDSLGNASIWTIGDLLYVGNAATGILNILDGGVVAVTRDVSIAVSASGTLNLSGNDATGRGILETSAVVRGTGTATLNLNGGILRANKDQATFIQGFTTLEAGSEGAWFDTNGFNIGVATDFTGSAGFYKLGEGTLTLTGASTYAGGTTIDAGTLQIGDGNTSGSITGDVLNNGVLAFNRSDDTLVIDGTISGTGAVEQAGIGKTTLTGTNTYTGGTTISAGTLQVGNGGASGSLKGNVTNNAALVFNRTGSTTMDGTISGSGSLTQIGGGTTILSGTNTYGGGTTISAGTLQLGDGGATGSILNDVTNNGVLAFNRSNVLTFIGTISGAGGVHQIGTGQTILSADNSNLTGTSQVQAGILSVNGILGGTMDVLGGARLQGQWLWSATPPSSAGGTIAPGNSIDTLTVASYDGNGGTLEIEAVLGDDNSASDLLAVTGATSGTTNVKVINLGGAGAATTQGIRIVDVGGVSGGTFSLLGDYIFEGEQAVVGGAYGYRLYKNTLTGPPDGDWYLRSALRPPAGSGQLFQPGAPIYEAYANILQSFNGPDTLQQRVGNRSWRGVIDNGGVPEAAGTGIWGRIVAGHASLDATASTTGADSDSTTWQLQAGADSPLYLGADGRLIGGLSARYGTISADIASVFGDGSIGSTGYGLGGSLTWYGNDGFYLDGQANLTWYDSGLSSSTAARSLVSGNTGFGYGLGVEAGQQIALGSNWSITPQAQLSYSAVDYDDFTDAFGAAVSLLDGDRLKIRLGLSADYQTDWTDTSGQTSRLHAYGIANLYYDLIGGSKTNLAGVILTGNTDPLWGGIGAGGSYSWEDEAYTLHGEVALNTALDHFGGSYDVTGTAGVRVKY